MTNFAPPQVTLAMTADLNGSFSILRNHTCFPGLGFLMLKCLLEDFFSDIFFSDTSPHGFLSFSLFIVGYTYDLSNGADWQSNAQVVGRVDVAHSK